LFVPFSFTVAAVVLLLVVAVAELVDDELEYPMPD
jgi:hypothetical protein